jgi:hypothetical protein
LKPGHNAHNAAEQSGFNPKSFFNYKENIMTRETAPTGGANILDDLHKGQSIFRKLDHQLEEAKRMRTPRHEIAELTRQHSQQMARLQSLAHRAIQQGLLDESKYTPF